MRGLGRGSGASGARQLAEIGIFVTAAIVGVILSPRPTPAQTTYDVPAGMTESQPTPVTSGSVIKTGDGTIDFVFANTYTDTTTVNAGTLALDNTAGVADSSLVTLAASGTTLDISNAGGTTSRVLELSGAAGSVVYLGANQLDVGNTGGTATFAGMIEGTGSLFESPTGSLTLTGANTYTGVTDITSGTLAIGAGGSIALSSGVDIIGGGTFDISNAGNQTIGDLTSTSGGTVSLGANTLTLGTANSTSFNGVISGTGGVTKQGAGTLMLTGTNTFTGTLTIDAGRVSVAGFGSISSASVNLAARGAMFDISAGGNQVIQDLSGAAGSTVSLGGNTLTFGTGTSTTFGGIVTGTGGLTKNGSGTVTLTGANTFSGGVAIDNGTLAIGTGGSMVSATSVAVNSASSVFSIANGGNQTIQNLTGVAGGSVVLGANTLTIDNTGGTTNSFAGVISGTGGIVVEGVGGTLTVNGTNTYTGSSVVTGGTLALGSSGSIASSSGVALEAVGATLDISGGSNQTIQGLSGILGSTVNLGANTLVVGSAGSTTFGGTIQGTTSASGLTKQGSGTLTLNGIEAYAGPTTINAGTLALGTSGSLAASSGINLAASGASFDTSNGGSKTIQDLTGVSGSAITLGANTLTLGTANSTNFAGNISGGGGALVKQGTGNLVLSGTNSYTGGTTIASGTLTGTTASLQGGILDDAALVFNQSTAGTYAGSLSGDGTLRFQGTGTVTLTGDSAGFAGTTTVSSGNLAVGSASTTSAELGGDVTVTSGIVSGHGTIGGNLTNSGGVVAPGGSVGTLTVNGNYSQGTNSTLAVQLTPAGASKLAVAGTVSLQGSLDILSGPNGYVPFSQYVILTSGGGISGTFQQVTGTFPVIPLSVVYQTNEIYLQLSGFTGVTPNESAVASILNGQIPTATGDFLNMLNLAVVLPSQQMQQALSSLGGQIYGNLADVALQDRRIFLEALTDRTRSLGGAWPAGTFGGIQGAWGHGDNALKFAQLGNALSAHDQQIMSDVNSYVSPPSGAVGGYWARGFGQFGKLDGNSGALGSSYSTGGGIIGADVISNPRAVLGLAVSGGQSSISLATNPETGTISFFQGGLYGAKEFDNGLVVDGEAIYAHDIYDITRGIVLPGISRTASSSHGGDDEVAALGLSRTFFYQDFRVLPRAELSYFHIGQSGFSETGAGSLDLAVSPADLDALYTRLGVTVVKPVMLGDTAIVPEFRAAWLHNLLDNYGQFSAAFAGAPTASFTQLGAPMGTDAAELGVGVSFGIARTSFGGELSGFVQYEAWLAEHELANAVGAGVRLKW